jgi:hypothetical protein
MTLAPSPDALTLVETARTFLNKSDDSTPELTLRLQILINSYSRAIRRFTGRQFKPVETGLARKYRYDGGGYLSLASSEATVVTSVVLHTDLPSASWRTLAVQSATVESEYRLEPRQKTLESTYLWLTLPELGRFSPIGANPDPNGLREARGFEVTVTGNWGAGVVPGDVEHACLISVANGYRNPESFASRGLGALQFTEGLEVTSDESGASLPRDARSLLYPYRRGAYS